MSPIIQIALCTLEKKPNISLCAKVTREVWKIRRSKICPFLYSNGHTEAKKIPENFFPWYHLACFFKMKIFKKFFLAKTHQEGLKIGCSQKFVLSFFSGHFAKTFFGALTNFWTFLMSFSQKKFFENFHLKKTC